MVIIAATVSAEACGGGAATSPSPSPQPSRLHFKAGPQILTFTGFALASDPSLPPCTPTGAPFAGTSVITQADLQQSGSQWIARSTAATGGGSLEVRINDTGNSSPIGDLINGTAQGSAIDAGAGLRPPNGVTATFSASSIVEGTVQRTAFFTMGRISGTISFSDGGSSPLSTGTCAAIQWMMQPTSGLFSLSGLEAAASSVSETPRIEQLGIRPPWGADPHGHRFPFY
jgi:hypothetical protein